MPTFKSLPQEQVSTEENEEAYFSAQYQSQRRERGLTYNHFSNSAASFEIELSP